MAGQMRNRPETEVGNSCVTEHLAVCKAHYFRMRDHERVSERPVYRLGTLYPSQLVTYYSDAQVKDCPVLIVRKNQYAHTRQVKA